MRAVMRRGAPDEDVPSVQLGDCTIDFASHRITRKVSTGQTD